MLNRIVAGAVALAAVLATLVLGATPTEAKQPPAKCKTVSITGLTTQWWVGTEGLPEGYSSAYRESYLLTERCRGQLRTRHVVTEWVLV